jgi:hypothetical protein
MHGLALSMGEKKRHNFAQTFARYHAIDIYIKFCEGNSPSVTL